jgi:hypothetical protein
LDLCERNRAGDGVRFTLSTVEENPQESLKPKIQALRSIRPQYHFSQYYGEKWSGRRGSNPRHPAWEAGILPTELLPHGKLSKTGCSFNDKTNQITIEYTTSRIYNISPSWYSCQAHFNLQNGIFIHGYIFAEQISVM